MRELVFDPKSTGFTTAWVNHIGSGDTFYCWGFLQAADRLVESALDDRGSLDFVFYPVCFLYRHAAEITLKELRRGAEQLIRARVALGSLNDGSELDEAAVDSELARTHRIKSLLDSLEARLALITDERIPPEHRNAVLQLDSFDPTGQRFRYSQTKQNGSLSASFPDQGQYDLVRIKTRLGEAIRFLQDCVGGMLDHENDVACDVLAELRSYADY